MYLKDVDQSKLEFPLLKKLIRDQINAGVVQFKDLKSTIPKNNSFEGYGVVEDHFEFDAPKDVVFDHYQLSDPNIAWKGGRTVAFGLGLDKNNGQIYYSGSPYPGAKVGHVLYIHCTILGLKKLCMAQELMVVDKEKGKVLFSYIEKGMTAGIQEILFTDLGNNKTRVTHISRFKGVSSFRDKFYPFFHSMIISKFHENLKASLNNLDVK